MWDLILNFNIPTVIHFCNKNRNRFFKNVLEYKNHVFSPPFQIIT